MLYFLQEKIQSAVVHLCDQTMAADPQIRSRLIDYQVSFNTYT